jgi:uncharacterized protein
MSLMPLSLSAILTIILVSISIKANAAPSYDCTRASTPDEIAICANPRLANLDVQVAEAFAQLREKIGSEAIRNLARSLLDMRRSCGADTTCIENAQRYAISSYRDALSGLRQQTGANNDAGKSDITTLIRAWNRANSDCRGSTDPAIVERSCDDRSQLSVRLERLGLCSGKYNLPFEDWDARILVRDRWIPCIYSNLVE